LSRKLLLLDLHAALPWLDGVTSLAADRSILSKPSALANRFVGICERKLRLEFGHAGRTGELRRRAPEPASPVPGQHAPLMDRLPVHAVPRERRGPRLQRAGGLVLAELESAQEVRDDDPLGTSRRLGGPPAEMRDRRPR